MWRLLLLLLLRVVIMLPVRSWRVGWLLCLPGRILGLIVAGFWLRVDLIHDESM
jgi:hypothetical protein